MIGGSGEKKTLRMVAQYADESNLTCGIDEIPRKLDALAAHCERLGRDRSEIKVTKLVMMVIGRTHEQALASLYTYAELHGWPAEVVDLMLPQLTIGDPDTIGEAIRDLMATGLDGVTLNFVANAHDPEMVALAGRDGQHCDRLAHRLFHQRPEPFEVVTLGRFDPDRHPDHPLAIEGRR